MLEVVDELLLVSSELGRGAIEKFGSTAALLFERTQAASKDCFADKSDGHTQVKSINGSPFPGSFLPCSIQDLFHKRCSIIVVVTENISGNLNQEGVEDAAIPFVKDISHFLS